jgi:hypothetical protein
VGLYICAFIVAGCFPVLTVTPWKKLLRSRITALAPPASISIWPVARKKENESRIAPAIMAMEIQMSCFFIIAVSAGYPKGIVCNFIFYYNNDTFDLAREVFILPSIFYLFRRLGEDFVTFCLFNFRKRLF